MDKKNTHQRIDNFKNVNPTNLSEHNNIYLCHFKNGHSKILNLTISNQSALLQTLIDKLQMPIQTYNLLDQNEARFEQFKMTKIQCEVAFDENFPRKFMMSSNIAILLNFKFWLFKINFNKLASFLFF